MPAKPTIEQLREIAQTYGLHLSDTDLESFTGLMSAGLEAYRRIDPLSEPTLAVRYPRTGGSWPNPSENPPHASGSKDSSQSAPRRLLSWRAIPQQANVGI